MWLLSFSLHTCVGACVRAWVHHACVGRMLPLAKNDFFAAGVVLAELVLGSHPVMNNYGSDDCLDEELQLRNSLLRGLTHEVCLW